MQNWNWSCICHSQFPTFVVLKFGIFHSNSSMPIHVIPNKTPQKNTVFHQPNNQNKNSRFQQYLFEKNILRPWFLWPIFSGVALPAPTFWPCVSWNFADGEVNSVDIFLRYFDDKQFKLKVVSKSIGPYYV